MYLDLAGHIRVRLRVLTVWSIFVLIMFYHRSIKLLHSFWWFTMTCKASLWCILRWISLFVCSKPLSHLRFPRIRDFHVSEMSTHSRFRPIPRLWSQVIAIKQDEIVGRVYLCPRYIARPSLHSLCTSYRTDCTSLHDNPNDRCVSSMCNYIVYVLTCFTRHHSINKNPLRFITQTSTLIPFNQATVI